MAIGKRIRFEVFKRDGFKCQYCGRTPPEVVLEIDHFIPKIAGGKDSIENYITACFDCNRGKGSTKLESVPASVQANITLLREKRKQLKAYNRFLLDLQEETEDAIEQVDRVFNKYFPHYQLSDSFRNNTLKRFLTHLPGAKVQEAMGMACSQFSNMGTEQWVSRRAIKYFCGICWNWIKNPDSRDWI